MGNIIAITGAAGKKTGGSFARNVSKHLKSIENMFPGGIRLLVRESSDIRRLKRNLPDAELCIGELKDSDYLEKALKDVDTIVHIAGIQYSREIVDAAAKCKVRRVIFVHTTGVYSKYKSASKEYKETDEYVYQVCKNSGIILTVCRPTMIYGNVYDNNIIEFIKMVDKFYYMPVVNHARYALQPVHYTDLGKALYQILVNEDSTKNKDYNLSGGSPMDLRDMLTIIGKNLGKKVRFINCPFPIAYAGACGLFLCTLGKKDYREKVQRLCEPRTFSYEDATRDFGYSPMRFEDGVVAEVRQYKKRSSRS